MKLNILFISKLSGKMASGPTYSVPNQINSQSKYDNVFWYNLDKVRNRIYTQYPFYHDLSEFPECKISNLPSPFNKPDLIIIEEVYVYHSPIILWEIMRTKIPYIIVPRSQLTMQAQKRKALKKKIGNFLIYNNVIRHSSAIQFLSQQEKKDSNYYNQQKHFIIPNGIHPTSIKKSEHNSDVIRAIYIGRLEPYQKGLDLLIQSCAKIRNDLITNHFILNLYGTSSEKDINLIKSMIVKYNLSHIIYVNSSVYNDEKSNVLQNSDIFVMTSRFEGQPMGLLEALAYGLPCLVTKGTNMREDIDKFNAGWSADNTVDDIKNALLALLDDKQKFHIKCKNAVNLAANYDWNAISRTSHEIYKNITANEA